MFLVFLNLGNLFMHTAQVLTFLQFSELLHGVATAYLNIIQENLFSTVSLFFNRIIESVRRTVPLTTDILDYIVSMWHLEG